MFEDIIETIDPEQWYPVASLHFLLCSKTPIAVRTIQKQIEDGKLKASRLGQRCYRVKGSDFCQWLKSWVQAIGATNELREISAIDEIGVI